MFNNQSMQAIKDGLHNNAYMKRHTILTNFLGYSGFLCHAAACASSCWCHIGVWYSQTPKPYVLFKQLLDIS